MAACLALVLAAAPVATAGERSISKVRQAAIERMQQKLGGLRGSIAPQDRIIMLTNKLIEMRKPVPEPTRIRGSRGFDTLTTASILPNIDERGSFYTVKRKSRSSGFTLAAGAEPVVTNPEELSLAQFVRDPTNNHGL